MILKFTRTRSDAKEPVYKSAGAVALDLYGCDDAVIPPGELRKIDTGIAVEIPEGYEGQIRPRSGMTAERVRAELGTIDQDYRGALQVLIINLTEEPAYIVAGTRIAQFVIAPVMKVTLVDTELDETERGNNGFGSTKMH